jgi:hypothetical protein
MAKFGMTFDPGAVPEGDRPSGELLPSGRYTAQIIESNVADTKSGRGQIATLTWEILDGPHERRRVWSRVNVFHENQMAQDIGQRFLKQITDALNLGPIDDTTALEFQPVEITVGIEKSRDPQYPDRNEVKRVSPLPGRAPKVAPSARPAPASTARPAAQAQPARRPWEKPKVNKFDDEIPF